MPQWILSKSMIFKRIPLSLSLSPSLSPSLSLSHTHTHTMSLPLTLSLSFSYTHSPSPSRYQTRHLAKEKLKKLSFSEKEVLQNRRHK